VLILAGSAIQLPMFLSLVKQRSTLAIMIAITYVLYTALVLWIFRRIVKWERPTKPATALAFIWGLLVVGAFQLVANGGIAQLLLAAGGVKFYNDWAPAFSASFTEEALKAAGVLVALAVSARRPKTALFVFFIGATVGLGFQVLENVNTTFGYALGTDSTNIKALGFIFGFRAVMLGLFSHIMYTGVFALGLGYFLTRKDRGFGKRFGVLLSGIVFAMGAHFFNNSPFLKATFPDSPVGNLIKAIVPFMIFVIALVVARRHAKAVLDPKTESSPPAR